VVATRLGLGLLLFLLPCGCALNGAQRPRLLHDVEIREDAVWDGRVVIDGSVKVDKGVTLTIRPGTDIAFVRRDADGDGLGDGTLVVEGELLAVGTRAEPIRFHSAAAHPRPGDWLEIRSDFSRNLQLRYCEIRDSAYTLHAHFTRGVIEDCTIHDNIDGCRLGQGNFVIRNCLIEQNAGKGINFRNSDVEVAGNIIRDNGSGIFLFETDRPLKIHRNNLYRNLENFRLGDFFSGDVQLAGNWWGTDDPQAAAATIYDRKRDPGLGVVAIKPATDWITGTGPRDDLAGLKPAWSIATGGFVDAGSAVAGELALTASWDGSIRALDRDGKVRWQVAVGDVVDATPAVAGGQVYFQSWGRQVYALSAGDGALVWRFGYPPSPADDHRQGGILPLGDLVLVPAWNGNLYALNAADGELQWSYFAGLPLRSTPASDGERIYQASGSGRFVVLDLAGQLLWQQQLPAPLLAGPALTPEGPVALDKAGHLVAFAADGSKRWQRDLGAPCYYGAPVHAAGALFVPTTAGDLWKLDAATGATIWRLSGAGPIYATPALWDGRVLFGDNNGLLHVVGADSGERLATYAVGGEIQGTPLPVGGQLIFGSRDHQIHVLSLRERGEEQLR